MLEVKDVSKRYGTGELTVHALSGVSLQLREGEFVALMGPSGSGKSTLLNLAGGLDEPTTGSVSIDGSNLAALSSRELNAVRRERIGFVFQALNLMAPLTALENVMLPLELDGMRTRAARALAKDALHRVGLSDISAKFPDDCSGGQQQRIAIARAIVGDRRYVLADEPTGALDTAGGDRIIDLLASLCAEGRAVLLVTHEPRFASWTDRVLYMRDGAMVDDSANSSRAHVSSQP